MAKFEQEEYQLSPEHREKIRKQVTGAGNNIHIPGVKEKIKASSMEPNGSPMTEERKEERFRFVCRCIFVEELTNKQVVGAQDRAGFTPLGTSRVSQIRWGRLSDKNMAIREEYKRLHDHGATKLNQ